MVLVTGASGFVGAHLARTLSEQGATVRALYNRTAPTAEMQSWRGVLWVQTNLLDGYAVAEVMEGITEVYHCAAIVSFSPARRDETIHVNSETTCNVVNAALDAGVRKLIHFSSVAALGRDGTAKEITEEAQWEESRLNSAYALGKYAAEMEVWRGIGEGLDAVIINPGIILGEPLIAAGWHDGAPRLMQTAWEEFPFYTDGLTAFVDVKDVVRAAIALMHSDISAERFILSAGNIPFRTVFTKMAESLGRKPPRRHAGKLATGAVWRWSALKSAVSGQPPLITKETARNAQLQTFYNGSKIAQALSGFNYTSLDATIRRMAAAYKAQMA